MTSWIRSQVSFALLRSMSLCLKGSRLKLLNEKLDIELEHTCIKNNWSKLLYKPYFSVFFNNTIIVQFYVCNRWSLLLTLPLMDRKVFLLFSYLLFGCPRANFGQLRGIGITRPNQCRLPLKVIDHVKSSGPINNQLFNSKCLLCSIVVIISIKGKQPLLNKQYLWIKRALTE